MSFFSAPGDGAHTAYMVVEAQSRHRSVPYPSSEEETHMALPPNDSGTPTLTLQLEGSARPPRAIG